MKRSIFYLLGSLTLMLTASMVASAQWYRGNLKDTLKRLERRFGQIY